MLFDLTARSELAIAKARPQPDFILPQAGSPIGVKPIGQWDLSNRDAVGLWTPTVAVQVLCAMPRAEDSETSHLIELVRLQAVTRREAKIATQEENPLVEKTALDLIDLILKSQGTDPLCIRLKKELGQDGQNSHKSYTLS